jgi:hypothetical protein
MRSPCRPQSRDPFVRSGDLLVGWKLGRLARSMSHLIDNLAP